MIPFKPKTLDGDRPISNISLTSGIWVNGTKEMLHEGISKHDRSKLPPSSQVSALIKTPCSSSIKELTFHQLKNEKKKLSVSYSFSQLSSFCGDEKLTSVMVRKDSCKEEYEDNEDLLLPTSLHRRPFSSFSSFDYSNSSRDKDNWYLSPKTMNYSESTDYDTDDEPSEENIKESAEEFIKTVAFSRSAMISPYEKQLFELRREKLKLEEAYLLKMKCEEELEKTRFPAPKWYELKTKQFTTEMEKHNTINRNKSRLKDLIDYRNELFRKSKQYSEFKLDNDAIKMSLNETL